MQSGNEWNWVWHYLATAGTTETDLVVLTALRDHLDLACAGLEVHAHISIDSTECELFVWDSVLNRFDGTAQIDWTTYNGTNAADVVPNQIAALVKFFTNVGRRQGRKYLPGFTDAGITANTWTAGILAAMATWATNMDNLVPSGGVTMFPCVWNTTIGSVLFETSELYAGVSAVDTGASTQRRRKPNVGI